MKKIFLIAASAMMVLASCTKVDINYPDNGQPQEIAMFAVNKSATKAPVDGKTFPTTYNMMVAAYLAAGDATTEVYFTDKIFSNSNGVWTGGQYWPVSAATLNFVAIAPETEDEDQVTTEISETGVATVNIANNETNQYDVMYAVGQSTKTAGQQPDNVDMVFKHALSWVNFTFNTTNTEGVTIEINSVKINGAAYNGTLKVTSTSFSGTGNQTATTKWGWEDEESPETPEKLNNISVPGADDGLDLNTTINDYQPFGAGLLVAPKVQATNFVINYTITQTSDKVKHTFNYTYPLKSAWDAAKKYTYAVDITLSEIKINPSVEVWDEKDENNKNWGAEVPLG